MGVRIISSVHNCVLLPRIPPGAIGLSPGGVGVRIISSVYNCVLLPRIPPGAIGLSPGGVRIISSLYNCVLLPRITPTCNGVIIREGWEEGSSFHHTVYLSITPQIIPTWNGAIMREMWGYGSPLVIQCNYLLLFPTKPIGQTVLRTITAADRERPCVEPLQLSTREGWYINCLGSSLVVCLIPLK